MCKTIYDEFRAELSDMSSTSEQWREETEKSKTPDETTTRNQRESRGQETPTVCKRVL